ncbi:YceD family protein [Herbaspirillum sp. GCM10030257]|uniref:YceD family protein n=1 Tax=Herbaspirillum sp. GCM10030257 TaxID=3273393 RepID=UPI003609E9AD
MNAYVIDAFEFCRVKEHRDGELKVAELPRLAEEAVDQTGLVRWALKGGTNMHGHPQLNLSVTGSVKLMCQRCLAPFEFMIESDSVLVLAPDEGSADEIDTLLADEEVEVIVGSRTFDIRQLIEDEALLTIPLSPKHETCPDQLVLEPEKEVEKVSPFAVLKNLKQ